MINEPAWSAATLPARLARGLGGLTRAGALGALTVDANVHVCGERAAAAVYIRTAITNFAALGAVTTELTDCHFAAEAGKHDAPAV